MITRYRVLWLWSLVATCAYAGDASNPPLNKPRAKPDGTLETPAFSIPFSTHASEAARRRLLDGIAHPVPYTPGDIQKTRRDIDEQIHEPLLQSLGTRFPVSISAQFLGGVPTEIITPKAGIAARNKARVLMNLHGGGFQVSARLGGRVEAIPIAATGRIKVVAVDYRQGPENKFPAGSEDVGQVYKELLKSYRPEDIGIYGCSAGGILTAEAVAWFQARGLPSPGAIGIFSAGAMGYADGDSLYTGAVLSGRAAPAPTAGPLKFNPYFGEANLRDALISPVHSPEVLARFPATLIVSGGRDAFLSSALVTHTELVKAGVDARLHVWEGMSHCFFFYPELPESREAWNVIVNFFDRHLGERS